MTRITARRPGPRAWLPIVTGLLAISVVVVAGMPELYAGTVSAQSIASLVVTGVATNHSSARVSFEPVAGARDYRIYDRTAVNNVKYAGLAHLTASASCPGPSCLNHFAAQADGVTPVFGYQVVGGASGGPQVLDVPATDIEWNSLGDGQQHTLVVEAVDQLGPTPQANLYSGLQNLSILNSSPAGIMLGSNKGPTSDGNISTNGQGPFTNTPQVIARSQPFLVQARQDIKAIPSRPSATQLFYDTFENSENATITQISRQDSAADSFGNLGSMTYSMNGGSPKEWTIEYRQADNINSMPFVSSDHFMDMLFDGATPNTSAPTHTIYGSMSMTPRQTLDMSSGKALHMTMEVDGHQSFRRWLAFELAPASDPLQAWDPSNATRGLNTTDRALFLELRDGSCTLDIFTGPASSSDRRPTGTAGGSAHGARLWGQAGSVGGAPIPCGAAEMYNPTRFTKNGFGLDDRSRFDLFLTQDHAALFEDGQLIVQSAIPTGSFAWANVPLKAYYSHYLYHSDADLIDLRTFVDSGAGMCYPLNSYWFNDPLKGSSASSNVCNVSYPAGYGFPFSDERHWDNMGFEVWPASAVPAKHEFSSLTSSVQPPRAQTPQFVGAGIVNATPTSVIASVTPTQLPTSFPTSTAAAMAVGNTPGPTNTPTTVPAQSSGGGRAPAAGGAGRARAGGSGDGGAGPGVDAGRGGPAAGGGGGTAVSGTIEAAASRGTVVQAAPVAQANTSRDQLGAPNAASVSAPNLLHVAVDSAGALLVSDRLSVGVPSNVVGQGGAELNVLLLDSSSVPRPADGFGLGTDAFVITLKEFSTATQTTQLSSPLALEYRLSAAEISQAGGNPGRLKVAAWSDDAWVALACTSTDTELDCTVPHPSLFAVLVAPPSSDTFDAPLSNGWFYKEANGFDGAGDAGFSIVDDGDAAFWTEFQRLGGVERLGYPISTRFPHGGFLTQAFQRSVLQWRPELNQAVPVNVFDDLAARGADTWLENARQVPPAGSDADLSSEEEEDIVARHLGLLDAYPELRDFYAADPDALTLYGLPQTIKQYGPLLSLRLQRGTLQLWMADMPWAPAGTVVSGNAGDLAKDAGLWPENAVAPEPAAPPAANTVRRE
jgi:hypothetical protein